MTAVKLDVFQLVSVFMCIGTVFRNLFRYWSVECITVVNVVLLFRGKQHFSNSQTVIDMVNWFVYSYATFHSTPHNVPSHDCSASVMLSLHQILIYCWWLQWIWIWIKNLLSKINWGWGGGWFVWFVLLGFFLSSRHRFCKVPVWCHLGFGFYFLAINC